MEGEEGVRHKDRTAIHGAVNVGSSPASRTIIGVLMELTDIGVGVPRRR